MHTMTADEIARAVRRRDSTRARRARDRGGSLHDWILSSDFTQAEIG
jgi:hypothetical protein